MFYIIDKYNKRHMVDYGQFPDGTLHLDNGNYGSISHIIWNYDGDAELFTLMCLRSVYNSPKVILEIPYLPHARMDRVVNPNDTFTLKVFCEAINKMNFQEVRVFDVHSNVSLALLDRVVNISPEKKIQDAIFNIYPDCPRFTEKMENFMLFFPDEGAMKRYSTMFKIPYTFGIKDRDWETGKIKSLKIMNSDMVKGKTILIVDDICSKGGTFKYSAEALKAAGAGDIYLYVSHAEDTMFDGEVYKGNLVKRIFTTTSIHHYHDDQKHKIVYL